MDVIDCRDITTNVQRIREMLDKNFKKLKQGSGGGTELEEKLPAYLANRPPSEEDLFDDDI